MLRVFGGLIAAGVEEGSEVRAREDARPPEDADVWARGDARPPERLEFGLAGTFALPLGWSHESAARGTGAA